MKTREMKINVSCERCHTIYQFKVNEEDFIDYMLGDVHVQVAFPYLTPGERELLLTHTCEKCWNKMFGGLDNKE